MSEGGDYIPFSIVEPAQIGLTPTNRIVELWVEGVRIDKPAGTDEITFEVLDATTFDTICKDVVRVTVQDI